MTTNPKWFDFSRKVDTGMYIRKEKKEISLIKDLYIRKHSYYINYPFFEKNEVMNIFNFTAEFDNEESCRTHFKKE